MILGQCFYELRGLQRVFNLLAQAELRPPLGAVVLANFRGNVRRTSDASVRVGVADKAKMAGECGTGHPLYRQYLRAQTQASCGGPF